MSYPSIIEATIARDEIVARMSAADVAYHENDAPIMEDDEYDSLKRVLSRIEEDFPTLIAADSPTQKVGSKATSAFTNVKHSQRMESLANTFTPAEVAEWVQPLGGEDAIILGELKMDGLSCRLTYRDGVLVQAVTRGDGDVGEDITHTALNIHGLPLEIGSNENEVIEVNGEVYLPKAAFDAYNEREVAKGKKGKPFVNCRNGAAGALRRGDADSMKDIGIRFMAFGVTDASYPELDSDAVILDLLAEASFEVVPHVVITGHPTAIRVQIGSWSVKRPDMPFDIDGVVWKLDSRKERKKLGSRSNSPRWATAYKFPAERKTTRLNDIVIQTGRTGAQTPVGILEPIFVGGVTVSNVTLHNEDEIERLGLVPGAAVIVQRAGDVIPQVVGLAGPATSFVTWNFPTTCVSCGSVTIREEGQAVRRCVNSAACPAQLQAHLEHFVSRKALDIDGLGGAQMADLIKYLGLKKASDIMALPEASLYTFGTAEDWCMADMPIAEAMEQWSGYGKSSVKKLLTAIKKARSPDLARFIYSLGIRNVGEGTSKDIAKHLGTVEAFFSAVMEDDGFWLAEIDTIDGVGPVVMKSIESHFRKKANYDEVFALRTVMDIKDMPKANAASVAIFAGENLCFTGGLDRWSRDQALLIAEELGAKVTNSAAKSTTILICGSGVGAVKMKKAQDNGTRCETEAWFIAEVERAVALGYTLDVMD